MFDKKKLLSLRSIITVFLLVGIVSFVVGFFTGRNNGEYRAFTGCAADKINPSYLKELTPGGYSLKSGEEVYIGGGFYYPDPSVRSLVGEECELVENVKVWDKYNNKFFLYRAWVKKGNTGTGSEGSDLAVMPNP